MNPSSFAQPTNPSMAHSITIPIIRDPRRRPPRRALHRNLSAISKERAISEILHARSDIDGGGEGLQRHEVGGHAGDVRGGHARAADDVGGGVAVDPGAEHVDAGREDVDDGAEVGEGGDDVVAGAYGADCYGGGGGGRGVVCCV